MKPSMASSLHDKITECQSLEATFPKCSVMVMPAGCIDAGRAYALATCTLRNVEKDEPPHADCPSQEDDAPAWRIHDVHLVHDNRDQRAVCCCLSYRHLAFL